MTLEVCDGVALRLLAPENLDELHPLILRNLDRLKPWFEWIHDDYLKAETAAFLMVAEQRARAGSDYTFGIFDRGALAGLISAHERDAHNHIARIGYWIDRDSAGRGLVTAAARTIVSFAFQTLRAHRLEIRCAPENYSSRRIPERLGFTNEGTQREVLWVRDHYQDLTIYALLREEWGQ